MRFGLPRNDLVRVGNAVLALNAAALTGALFFTSLDLQLVLDYSPLAVGTAFAPITVIVLVVSPVAGNLAGRIGLRNLLLIGTAFVAAIGLALLASVAAATTRSGETLASGYRAGYLCALALVALAALLAARARHQPPPTDDRRPIAGSR